MILLGILSVTEVAVNFWCSPDTKYLCSATERTQFVNDLQRYYSIILQYHYLMEFFYQSIFFSNRKYTKILNHLPREWNHVKGENLWWIFMIFRGKKINKMDSFLWCFWITRSLFWRRWENVHVYRRYFHLIYRICFNNSWIWLVDILAKISFVGWKLLNIL